MSTCDAQAKFEAIIFFEELRRALRRLHLALPLQPARLDSLPLRLPRLLARCAGLELYEAH